MTLCPHCSRHHRADEGACPFCGQTAAKGTRIPQSVAAAFSAFVLMACYGAPPGGWDDSGDDSGNTAEDLDNDGYNDDVDCDDGDATVHPGATEDCANEIDDDCDELTDAADTTDCGGT